MANRIVLNETSYHGSGAIKEIVNEVKGRNLKKAFVCSDPDLIKFNVTTKVTNILEESNLEYEIYSNIKPNPTIENVQNGVNAYKKSNADYIIAIGGGSSIDTAKAIGIIINNVSLYLYLKPSFSIFEPSIFLSKKKLLSKNIGISKLYFLELKL